MSIKQSIDVKFVFHALLELQVKDFITCGRYNTTTKYDYISHQRTYQAVVAHVSQRAYPSPSPL
jgi:hypothetical protein